MPLVSAGSLAPLSSSSRPGFAGADDFSHDDQAAVRAMNRTRVARAAWTLAFVMGGAAAAFAFLQLTEPNGAGHPARPLLPEVTQAAEAQDDSADESNSGSDIGSDDVEPLSVTARAKKVEAEPSGETASEGSKAVEAPVAEKPSAPATTAPASAAHPSAAHHGSLATAPNQTSVHSSAPKHTPATKKHVATSSPKKPATKPTKKAVAAATPAPKKQATPGAHGKSADSAAAEANALAKAQLEASLR